MLCGRRACSRRESLVHFWPGFLDESRSHFRRQKTRPEMGQALTFRARTPVTESSGARGLTSIVVSKPHCGYGNPSSILGLDTMSQSRAVRVSRMMAQYRWVLRPI